MSEAVKPFVRMQLEYYANGERALHASELDDIDAVNPFEIGYVFMRCLRGYDAHLRVEALAEAVVMYAEWDGMGEEGNPKTDLMNAFWDAAAALLDFRPGGVTKPPGEAEAKGDG